ncbi:hypothetical protein C5167_012793 [Papaver somniferum]|uniref:PLD phosphodiesterase domain-containing protein n=1 Tax=Papaver somniferum TaxID=3469 RepID=A0A4Y7J1K4_PAPSO|nr:phospholipase D Z-like [Papaver somniferum]RZC53930.1 hypothetical protein C5167_012793 [Papaver somniferum]
MEVKTCKSSNPLYYLSFMILLLLNPVFPVSSSSSSDDDCNCEAYLVQSIPTDMPHLPSIHGVLSTGDVFKWLAGNSTKRLDMIVQYWQFLAQPENPKSGDFGYSKQEMDRFGADVGYQVFQSLENAADRNVNIRILQHTGVYPDFTRESSILAAGRPNVQNVTLLLGDWWGSGIVHTKVWISDRKDIYIGSANNDWKSLTQVKEVGIYLVGCPKIAEEVEIYFDNLWTLAALNSSKYIKPVWDEHSQINREVPCWSHFVDLKERCRSPLPSYVRVPHVNGYPTLSDPSMFKTPIKTPGCNNSTIHHHSSYLSFAPPELLFGKFQSDEQAWLGTIKSVGSRGTLRISTMDWLGQSQYTSEAVFWSSLSSAISEVVFSKHAKVKILVAYWGHFINNTDLYLKSLLYTNVLYEAVKYKEKICNGKIEIKYYEVPGFNMTGPALSNATATGNTYPAYTRVNHGKYAVSDIRAHIGTSNLVWDYFYTTAGVSFGTYTPSLVSQLQEIFDADWNSPYAVPVNPLPMEIHSSW